MGKVRKFGRRATRKAQKQRPVREHVMIAVPCEGDYVHLGVQRLLALADRLSLDPKSPWEFTWTIEVGARPVQYARNKIVQTFLASDAQRLWMIDADMLPEGEIFALLGADADIVVPRMLALKRGQKNNQPRVEACAFAYNRLGDKRFNSIIPTKSGVVDCDGVGTGCTVIRRKVFEDPRMRLDPHYEWQGEACTLGEDEAPPFFRMLHAPNGRALRGEDLDFSWRAKQLGYTVRMVTGIACGHCKIVNLEDVARIANAGIEAALKAERREDAGTVQVDEQERAAAEGQGVR